MKASQAVLGAALVCVAGSACSRATEPAQSVLLITIDTLRADHVGAYGSASARTPRLDALAAEGTRFERAWTTAPITLTAHASLLSGRYPPAHGGRHNGVAVREAMPTLAAAFKSSGFATAAFVSAFPLDRRFGLDSGFDVYDDELGRDAAGKPANERPGSETTRRALDWLRSHQEGRVFLWVHLFEPHAPYGQPRAGGSAQARYAGEVAVADVEVGRLLDGLGGRALSTLIVATADHGEAFGEHGEFGHSLFVYDTTLRIPLIMRGPGIVPGRVVPDDVSLVDLAPTLAALTRTPGFETDGRSLTPALDGGHVSASPLYAETFAPLLDFGWAPLRALRDGPWKFIAAPKAELFDLSTDPGESVNRLASEPTRAATFAEEIERWSPDDLARAPAAPPDAVARLRSLGYLGGAGARSTGARPDPKDRVGLAAKLATVTAGEVSGDALIATLRDILSEDPGNPQAHLRLGFAEIARGRCAEAVPHLQAAMDTGLPSADAGIGLASCLGEAGDLAGAGRALTAARRAEPGNPVVAANLGILALEEGNVEGAVRELREALRLDATLYQARFALARALARRGDRQAALREATLLYGQLPADAPQRAEVARLLAALQ